MTRRNRIYLKDATAREEKKLSAPKDRYGTLTVAPRTGTLKSE